MLKKRIIGNVFTFLILILILAISASAVAADDTTENLTISNMGDIDAIPTTDNKTFPDIQTEINNAQSNDMIELDGNYIGETSDNMELNDLNASVFISEEMPHSETLNINHYDIKIDTPEDYNGNISAYIDENLIEPVKSNELYGIYPFEYEVGNHTLRVNFPQTSIYKELNLTKKFSIVETQIKIGKYGEYATASVKTAGDVTGTVTIFINGSQFKKVNLEKIFDRASGYSTQILNLNPGKYNITVVYSGNSKYKKCEKSKIVDITYEISYNEEINYYNDKILTIVLPENIKNKKIDVAIDGKNYPAKYDNENQYFNVNIDDLSIGNHSLIITYNGDSIFPKQTKNGHLTVYVAIEMNNRVSYGENPYVSLKLPASENGNLSLYLSKTWSETPDPENLYKTSSLSDGFAKIEVPGLDVGTYYFHAQYDGPTYVQNTYNDFEIFPELIIPSEINGRETTLYVNADKNITGTVELEIIDDEIGTETYRSFNIIEGKGSYKLSNLPLGKLHISPIYSIGEEEIIGKTVMVNVKGYTPVLSENKDIKMYYQDGSTFSVKVKDYNGKYSANNEIQFKIGSSTYYADTDSKGVAKLKITEKAGKYKITATYRHVSVTNNIIVKKILSMDTVKVKKSAKKIVLKAKLAKKLKGKTIKFKFNGNTYKAKTDKKGIAKVTVKNSVLKKLKVGKKVAYQASYVKETVKKTSKVLK